MKKHKTERKIPLYDIKLSAGAIKEVTAMVKSGWLNTGPRVAAFEKAICRLTKTRYGAAVGSATVGLQMVLTAINAQPGAEVVTTPNTFVSTVEAIMATGAKPVFADIDPVTLNIDPDEVARKISTRTVAVMPVDLGGYPADYDALNEICQAKRTPLIADAAHSIATKYRSRSVSHHADAAVISFQTTKNLACGEGGIILTPHKELIDVVRVMARHGLTSSAHQRKKSRKWEYDAILPGMKGNMSELHAAIGLGQLEVFENDQAKRETLAERYLENFSGLGEYLELPQSDRSHRHGWHLFIIRLHLSRLKIDRNKLIELMARRGVECSVHYKPIFELSYYRDALGLTGQHFPNATYAGQRVVTLPLYAGLKLSDVDYICKCISEIVKKYKR